MVLLLIISIIILIYCNLLTCVYYYQNQICFVEHSRIIPPYRATLFTSSRSVGRTAQIFQLFKGIKVLKKLKNLFIYFLIVFII